jgi:hypothetical protein
LTASARDSVAGDGNVTAAIRRPDGARKPLVPRAPRRTRTASSTPDRDRDSEYDIRTPAQRLILQLQRDAGNQAVAGLLHTVQRDIGWEDAQAKVKSGAGGKRWNAGTVNDVAGTHMRRIPVTGLTEGHQEDTLEGDSATLTDESAKGRAIVIVSSTINTKKGQKVDVLLHLHGYAETAKRPFAGWRQRRSDGAVRDVALDQVEQQLDAVGQPQLVGILAQGGERSQFGKKSSYELAMRAYINDVFDNLTDDPAFKERPELGRVILSAHSGGSHTIVSAMGRDLSGKRGTPGDLGEVILFDAINVGSKEQKAIGPTWTTEAHEPKAVARWLKARLDADVAELSKLDTAEDRKAYLATSFVFRGYYTGGYAPVYTALQKKIDRWFADPDLVKAVGGDLDTLRAHYTTVKTSGLLHEELMRGHKADDTKDPGKGNIADAVRAMYDPMHNNRKEMTAASTGTGAAPGKGSKPRSKSKGTGTSSTATAAKPAPHKPVVEPAAPAGPVPSGAATPKKGKGKGKKAPMTPQEQIDAAVKRASKSSWRGEMEADLRAKDSGMTAAKWFQGLKPDATFLGMPIRPSGGDISGIHEQLLAVLKVAEETAQARYLGKSLSEIAGLLGMYDIAGLRQPKAATGGTRPTMHAYGMAVDINYGGNPFMGQDNKKHTNYWGNRDDEMIRRATLLVTGHSRSIRENPRALTKAGRADTEQGRELRAKRAGELWEKHTKTSEALRDYLNLTDEQVEKLVGDGVHGHDLDWWKQQHAADKKLSRESGELKAHSDPAGKHGFMDIKKELVLLMVNAGLSWGGAYNSGKDLMHFDLRTGSIDREML